MNAIRSTFSRNLRGYLSAARITGAFATGRLTRSTRSMAVDPSDPVEPVSAVFSTLSESYEATTDTNGFQSITQNLLASNVLENLLQIQNEIADENDSSEAEQNNPNAQAARAYQHTQETAPKQDEPVAGYIIDNPAQVIPR